MSSKEHSEEFSEYVIRMGTED